MRTVASEENPEEEEKEIKRERNQQKKKTCPSFSQATLRTGLSNKAPAELIADEAPKADSQLLCSTQYSEKEMF